MKSRFALPPLTGLPGLLGGMFAAQAASADFARDIQPLRADRSCFRHGDKRQESGLRLDRRADTLKGGDRGPAELGW